MNKVYDKKIATVEGQCFICYKMSSLVLRNDGDFFYICQNHLSDRSFCSAVPPPVPTPTPPPLAAATAALPEEKAKGAKGEASKVVDKKLPVVEVPIPEPKSFILASSFLYLREKKKSKAKPVKPPRTIAFPAIPTHDPSN